MMEGNSEEMGDDHVLFTKSDGTGPYCSRSDTNSSDVSADVSICSLGSICHNFFDNEWKNSLLETEKSIVFRFRDEVNNFATLTEHIGIDVVSFSMGFFVTKELEKHHARLPAMNMEAMAVYEKKYANYSDQCARAMLHFLQMMELGDDPNNDPDEIWEKIAKLAMTNRGTFRMKIEPILPNEPNVMNKCFETLQPKYASEIFYAFGLEVACVESMESIYEFEKALPEEFVDVKNIILEPAQLELHKFIKDLFEDLNIMDNKNFLTALCSKIWKNDSFTPYWYTKDEIDGPNTYLVNHMMAYLEKLATRDHSTLNEQNQCDFLLKLMNDLTEDSENILSCCQNADRIEITQLKQPESPLKGLRTTDLEFWERNKTKKIKWVMSLVFCELETQIEITDWKQPMETELYEGTLLSTKIECTLLWRITEALFGRLMNTPYDENMNNSDVLLQGGMLICNDKVRSVVLAMRSDFWKVMRQKKCARDTFSLIRYSTMWGRLYVEGIDHHIVDSLSRAKFTYKNFCKCIQYLNT